MTTVEEAKQQYEAYSAENNKPEDWTQELQDQKEEAFYALQKEALGYQRAIAEVQALKDAQDEAAAEADRQFQK